MPTNEVREISLRRFILTVHHYVYAGFRGWIWVALVAILGAGYMAWSAAVTPVRFEAKIAFVVNNNQMSSGGGIGSMLGQIALGGKPGGANLQRIKSFITSRQIMNELLLEKVIIAGDTDLVANHLIKVEKLVEEFEMDPAFGPVRISGDTLDNLSRQERSLMKTLYSYLVTSKNRPLVPAIDEITDMLKVTVNTQNEDLSLYLVESLFNKLTRFYTEETTGPARNSVNRLQNKADSILTELNAAEYQLASFVDTRRSLLNQRDQLGSIQLNRKIVVLGTAYGEIVRNLETAKFSLDAATPYFKLVEAPFKPLNQKRKYLVREAILGGIFGGFLGLLLVVGVAFYQDVMAGREIGVD